jgi:hypothetical protein
MERPTRGKMTGKERVALKKRLRKARKERRDSDDEGSFEADLEDPRFAVRLFFTVSAFLSVIIAQECCFVFKLTLPG